VLIHQKGCTMVRRSSVLLTVLGLLLLTILPPRTRANNPPLVAIQAGHWLSNEHAEEFERLRPSTGAHAANVREVDLNVDVSHRVAEYLRSWGNEAYVLPATVPPGYKADAFVAIHGDGHANTRARGYKVATYWRDWVATDMLVRELEDEYGRQTGLPKDWRITANMRGYYAFNSGLYEHTIAEDTPGAIIELGFLTNPTDRAFLLNNRDLVARAVALGIARFLGTRPAGGWPEPPRLPRGDIVEILDSNVPLYSGPATDFEIVERAYRRERYAVSERRPGWAKLFSYRGMEQWIEDFHTRQITVP
jgi:N-acetylmuramoyl-L-alanine amidase